MVTLVEPRELFVIRKYERALGIAIPEARVHAGEMTDAAEADAAAAEAAEAAVGQAPQPVAAPQQPKAKAKAPRAQPAAQKA